MGELKKKTMLHMLCSDATQLLIVIFVFICLSKSPQFKSEGTQLMGINTASVFVISTLQNDWFIRHYVV